MVSTLLVSLITLLQLAHSSPLSPRNEFNSLWYDAGLYGAYVDHEYVSSDHTPPKVNFLHSESCDPGFTFISPRGKSVPKPGPIILDPQGELIWMDDRYGQAMDFRVQQYRGEDYLTFWAGTDSGTHGTGSYYMVRGDHWSEVWCNMLTFSAAELFVRHRTRDDPLRRSGRRPP